MIIKYDCLLLPYITIAPFVYVSVLTFNCAWNNIWSRPHLYKPYDIIDFYYSNVHFIIILSSFGGVFIST